MTPLSEQMQDLCSAFAREGYVTLPNVVSKSRLAALTDELRGEYARAKASGELFSGGGTVSGHLNCFPGAQSRFVYDELEQYGAEPTRGWLCCIGLPHRECCAGRYGPPEWRDGGRPRHSLTRVQVLAV